MLSVVMEFQLKLFKILKLHAVKVLHSVWQQIWKPNHRPQDWKSQFPLKSQRKAIPKDIQTTIQVCSFHKPAKLCSKSLKLGFNNMWTKNFQMFKLNLEKAETRDQIVNSCWIIEKIKRIPKNTSASLTTLKPLTVWIVPNWKILKEIEIPDHLTCLLRNLYAG